MDINGVQFARDSVSVSTALWFSAARSAANFLLLLEASGNALETVTVQGAVGGSPTAAAGLLKRASSQVLPYPFPSPL